MNIKRTQSINFNGRVELFEAAKDQKKLLKSLITHLHKCGNNDVVHYVSIDAYEHKNFISIFSYFQPKGQKIDFVNGAIRSRILEFVRPIEKKDVKKIADWSKGTKPAVMSF